MSWLDRIPWVPLIVVSVFLGMAPWPAAPEPHLFEKLGMLADGTLSKPIDIFDLLLHATGPILVILKLIRQLMANK